MAGFRGILPSSILFIVLHLQIHHISAQTYLCYACEGGYTTPAFEANLNTITSTVSTNINSYGFYNGTAGDGVDQVNAIALCRGDVDVRLCRKCVKEAAQSLTTTNCTNTTEAVTWYDKCMFRYSNNPILGIVTLDPFYLEVNNNDASNVTLFIKEVRSFAASLIGQAYKGSFRKFAAKKSSKSKIYGFMQCTTDLTPSDCKSCLKTIADYFSAYYSQVGGKYMTPSCSFQYEIYPFLKNLSNQASLPPQ